MSLDEVITMSVAILHDSMIFVLSIAIYEINNSYSTLRAEIQPNKQDT